MYERNALVCILSNELKFRRWTTTRMDWTWKKNAYLLYLQSQIKNPNIPRLYINMNTEGKIFFNGQTNTFAPSWRWPVAHIQSIPTPNSHFPFIAYVSTHSRMVCVIGGDETVISRSKNETSQRWRRCYECALSSSVELIIYNI